MLSRQPTARAALVTALGAAILTWSLSAHADPDGSVVSGVIVLSAPDKRGEPPVRNSGFVPRAKNSLKPPRAFNPLPHLVVVLTDGEVSPADAKPGKRPVKYPIIGESFSVPLLPVIAGSVVEIVNKGKRSPRLYSPGNAEFVPSDPINPEGVPRQTETVDEPHAPIELRDRDSAHLRGTIVAFPHAYFALPNDSGRFEIDGVPSGTWKVRVWYRDGWLELPSEDVDVPVKRGARPLRIELPPNLKIANSDG